MACNAITFSIGVTYREFCVASFVDRQALLSIDGGAHWASTSVPSTQPGSQKTFSSVTIGANGRTYMIGQNVLVRSELTSTAVAGSVPLLTWSTTTVTDGGAWNEVSTFNGFSLVLVSGDAVRYFQSSTTVYSDGTSFMTSETVTAATCVSHISADVAIACSGLQIIKTDSGGRSWAALATFPFTITDAVAVNSTMYFVVGMVSGPLASYFSSTLDGGVTWNTITTNSESPRPLTICATNGTGRVVSAGITRNVNTGVVSIAETGQTSLPSFLRAVHNH